jgi:hypothetical protein
MFWNFGLSVNPSLLYWSSLSELQYHFGSFTMSSGAAVPAGEPVHNGGSKKIVHYGNSGRCSNSGGATAATGLFKKIIIVL